jgi:hypothetical protein
VIFRRPREWAEIVGDPKTPYMIGRLLGANEMAIVVLRNEENEKAVLVANALEGILSYFISNDLSTRRIEP